MKRCSKCSEEKPLDAFGNLKKGRDGKCSYCKECAKKGQREWYGKNKDRISERVNKYLSKRREDSKYTFQCVLRNQVRRYIVDKKGKSTEDILGETFDNVRLHLEKQFVEGMNWNNHGEWHIDHIIPLSSGSSEEEYIKLNHYTNLQPLWATDNLKKGSKR